MRQVLSIVILLLSVCQEITFTGKVIISGKVIGISSDGSADDSVIQGAGATATGGQGGQALTIDATTDVDDSAATTAVGLASNKGTDGLISIREFATVSGARIGTFSFSGNIALNSSLTFTEGSFTIDGSTAPNGGVAVTGGTTNIAASNFIVGYMRFRSGASALNPGSNDGLQFGNGVDGGIIHHCSISWAKDECLGSSSTAKNITIQWCIIAEGLDFTDHTDNGSHSKASLIYRSSDGAGDGKWSVHHNLYVNSLDRHLEIGQGVLLEQVNNVFYNGLLWGNFFTSASANDRVHIDAIGNYYIEGPMSEPTGPRKEFTRNSGNWLGDGTIYIEGNLGPNRPTLGDSESAMLDSLAAPLETGTPHISPPTVIATSAAQALIDVLAKAGCRLPYLDAADQRVVWDVSNNSGVFIDDEDEMGGFPNLTLSSNTRAPSSGVIANNRLESEGENLTTITTETGHTWSKHGNYTGNVTLDTQRRAFSGDTMAYYLSWAPASADYYVKGRTTQLSSLGRACVAGRINTAADTMYLACRTTSSTLELAKIVTGTFTSLGTDTSAVSLESIKLNMVRTTIEAWAHGKVEISVTDSAISAAGRAGLRFDGGGSASTGFHLNRVSAREY